METPFLIFIAIAIAVLYYTKNTEKNNLPPPPPKTDDLGEFDCFDMDK